MPSQKKKLKKPKVENKPPVVPPVQIKSEPLGIKPLGAYIEDRVELIRQAFMCLKPKEIKCLAPDYLDTKSVESIQEQCLDEVLGISTKRLIAIINSTKCPTDTESSSDEDDKIIEHISLEEISSDSEVEVKKPTKNVKTNEKKSRKAREADSKLNANVNKNGGKKSEKEMTVLELLELQARARAIRSQLALEPVTKIELDSDQDQPSDTDDEQPKKKGTDKACVSGASSSKPSRPSPAVEQPKRVRLKRNFRIRQVGDEEMHDETSQEESRKSVDSDKKPRGRSKEKEEIQEKPENPPKMQDEDTAKEDTKSRDSSPEVIPMIPSPETLCISSDSEEEKARQKKASIFVENVEELDRQNKQSESQTDLNEKVATEEPEEGELSEEEKTPKKTRIDSSKSETENVANEINEPSMKNDEVSRSKLEHEEELDYEIKDISDSEAEKSAEGNDSTTKKDPADQPTIDEDVEKVPSASEKSDSSESEAESVSSDSEQEVDNKESSNDEDNDPDIVEIHDSSDETLLEQKMAEDEPTEKSWNSRWLESNRVAKVMAASRLGNKVRDKLKKKKKKEKLQEQERKEQEAKKPESPVPVVDPTPASNAEVGSVEHYRELIANSSEPPAKASSENAAETDGKKRKKSKKN